MINNFCYKPSANNIKFRFIVNKKKKKEKEKKKEFEKLFCFFHKNPYLLNDP